MTGLEKARATFLRAGLAFPKIPEKLACQLEERREWQFSTQPLKIPPYNVVTYIDESYHSSAPYVVLAHDGWGINSYALSYYLVFGPLRLFLHLSWGGGYSDRVSDAAEIQKCFSLADKILPASMTSGKLLPGEYLTIVCSLYCNYWGLSLPGYIRRSEYTHMRDAELLAQILKWLNDPAPRRKRERGAHPAAGRIE